MNRKRLSRLATVFTASAMLMASVAASPVAARNASWSIVPVRLPTVVAAGKNAGYFVTVTNGGTSNVNAVTLTVKPPAGAVQAPAYFPGLDWSVGGPEVSCTSSGLLVCDLGTLSAGETFTFTVAFLVPTGATGTFDVVFSLESTSGNTTSDGGTGNHSRGDALNVTSQTGIASSTNFDGGFVVGSSETFQTTGTLGRGNKQTTGLVTTDTIIPVTVTDDVASFPCDSGDPQCSRLIGLWSVLDVNGGTNSNPIKVTLMIWGGSVPGGVGVGDIYLIHADGSGGYNTVKATCNADPPTNADCLVSVTKVGSNFKIIAWLTHNGGLRGGY